MPGLRDWVIGAVGIASLVTVLLPRNNSTRIISAMGDSQASLIKAAMGTGPGPGTNREREKSTPQSRAEAFQKLAEQTTEQFWKGFTNDLD